MICVDCGKRLSKHENYGSVDEPLCHECRHSGLSRAPRRNSATQTLLKLFTWWGVLSFAFFVFELFSEKTGYIHWRRDSVGASSWHEVWASIPSILISAVILGLLAVICIRLFIVINNLIVFRRFSIEPLGKKKT
jgi:hypothetical protein